jgi:DNA-binding Xre family transcriptional regulator
LFHGRAKGIDFSTLDALCGALAVNPGELLERTPKKPPRSRG